MSWWNQAACKNTPTEVFFPTEPRPNIYAKAKQICASCPVRQECLDDTMRNEHVPRAGYVGGTTPTERDQIAHQHTKRTR